MNKPKRKAIIALAHQDQIVRSVLEKHGIANISGESAMWEAVLIELVIELVTANKTLTFYESLEVGERSDQYHNPRI